MPNFSPNSSIQFDEAEELYLSRRVRDMEASDPSPIPSPLPLASPQLPAKTSKPKLEKDLPPAPKWKLTPKRAPYGYSCKGGCNRNRFGTKAP